LRSDHLVNFWSGTPGIMLLLPTHQFTCPLNEPVAVMLHVKFSLFSTGTVTFG
jgi:hypothetical protein